MVFNSYSFLRVIVMVVTWLLLGSFILLFGVNMFKIFPKMKKSQALVIVIMVAFSIGSYELMEYYRNQFIESELKNLSTSVTNLFGEVLPSVSQRYFYQFDLMFLISLVILNMSMYQYTKRKYPKWKESILWKKEDD